MDVHVGLDLPASGTSHKHALVRGSYKYYHYCMGRVNDQGWGCGYRVLQTICSWICRVSRGEKTAKVPSHSEVQQTLFGIGDKPERFVGSRDWIGSAEVCFCLDELFQVPSKLIHIRPGTLCDYAGELYKHFALMGSPAMMGGDTDAAAKTLLGICLCEEDPSQSFLLILDPHYSGSTEDRQVLQSEGWVRWWRLSELSATSFYNICLPQLKAAE